MDFLPAPAAKVPMQGTLRRCGHGVYIPAGERTAQYCQQCHPNGPAFRTREVVLPRSSSDPTDRDGSLYANTKDRRACPNCGSTMGGTAEKREDRKRPAKNLTLSRLFQ